MLEKPKRYWQGSWPLICDLCKAEITTCFIDGKTAMGPWGILCPECHAEHGIGLGTGRGQRYEREGERFAKVE